MKIGIVGAPSAGKTSTAANLTLLLKNDTKYACYHVTEFATDFLQKHSHEITMVEQLIFLHEQIKREHFASLKSDIVITDSPVFLCYIYARNLNNQSPSHTLAITYIYDNILSHMRTYDCIILKRLRDFKTNGIRRNDPKEAKLIDDQIVNFLNDHNIRYIDATDLNNEQLCKQIIRMHDKIMKSYKGPLWTS